jgi:predicted nucleotide-binding protein
VSHTHERDQLRLRAGMTKPRIFIASAGESLKVATAIQANLEHDADCTVWSQGVMRLSRTTMHNLQEQLSKSDFGIFVFNSDDVLLSRGKKHAVARDNVVLELGMFAGRLGVERTFIVKPRGVDIKLPSDLFGLTVAEYEPDRKDDNLHAALGTACSAIRQEVKSFSPGGTT